MSLPDRHCDTPQNTSDGSVLAVAAILVFSITFLIVCLTFFLLSV
jgi:hypothetical protein